jgi:ABC-type dipeptide/oligopeptide/nickel transport system permease subunit
LEIGGDRTSNFQLPTSNIQLRIWQRLAQQRLALLAAGYIVLLYIVAIIGPWIAPYGPMIGDLRSTLQGPSIAHWFGTDHLGRDILSQIICYYSGSSRLS